MDDASTLPETITVQNCDYLDYRKLFNASTEIVASQQEEILKLEQRVLTLERRLERRDHSLRCLRMRLSAHQPA